ncbi:prolyl-tRNA synthetase 2-like protein, mitochondrial [Megachile rotundata]|uniref:prolyl-tRNA synthetase 2-like protein, mitochondrial n=1 Tax=Megachile rotundata TaxID=143995 RepID=UPI000614F1C0|nr:PREDICTED: probable proline--tRNA ligase, mitochondrial [Megachile rotundata]
MSNMAIQNISRMSRLFQPLSSRISTAKQSEPISKSYENLTRYGFIKQVNSGMYAYLPLALRVLNKLITIIDHEMEKIGGQKLLLPALTSTKLWNKTNRLDDNLSELFILNDRFAKKYILSPTCEESICNLLSTIGTIPSHMIPLRLYQISNKWRDEMKPRHGFIRSREFLMKDLYTFDFDLESAQKTYEIVNEAYENIFTKIGVTFIKAVGDTGIIGGLMSHEYHYKGSIGEDTVFICPSCQYTINKTICNDTHCPNCKNEFLKEQVAEIAHTFLLNTKYTEPLNVVYRTNNSSTPFVMGCYGIGISRIFMMLAETLSTKTELRWPKHLAPYTICIIPPKKGSKEEIATQYLDKIIGLLNHLHIDAILDDRTNLTIGNRLMHARVTGFPYVILIGKSAMQSTPLFEIHNTNNATQCEVTLENIYTYFNNEFKEDEELLEINKIKVQ